MDFIHGGGDASPRKWSRRSEKSVFEEESSTWSRSNDKSGIKKEQGFSSLLFELPTVGSYFVIFFLAATPRPIRPAPRSIRMEGSGTGVPGSTGVSEKLFA